MTGRAGLFLDELKAYIRFRKECDGVSLTPTEVNFEDFMAFLDVEHYFGLRGSDTWSEDGNEGQVVVKTLIGEILTERTPPIGKLPDLYIRFAELLQPDDYVLTFNTMSYWKERLKLSESHSSFSRNGSRTFAKTMAR